MAAKLGGPSSDPTNPDSSTATGDGPDGQADETARLIPPSASVAVTASGIQDAASSSSASGGPMLVKGALVRQAWGGVKSVWSASKAFVVDGTVVGEVVGPGNPEAAGPSSSGTSTSAGASAPSAAVAPKTPSAASGGRGSAFVRGVVDFLLCILSWVTVGRVSGSRCTCR